MNNSVRFLSILLIFSLVISYSNVEADATSKKPEMTQCMPKNPNDCGPVGYSNGCIGGGTGCSDRGCPSGTTEMDFYP